MSMINWAEKEIEIACGRERADSGNSVGWDYGCACYESALKAYKSLMDDGHSGYSIGVTKNILVRLIEGKCLTPIEDTPEVWNKSRFHKNDGVTTYQCTRLSSLFKDVDASGKVSYHDVGRTVVTYANNPDAYWSNGMASRIIDEMFPITMPYYPPIGNYTLYAEEFLVDPKNGDYDTLGYLYVRTPEGDKVDINKYFKEKDSHKFVEIDKAEYDERKARSK